MDTLETRLQMLKEGGFSTEEEYEALHTIVDLLAAKGQYVINDESLGVMITHIAAAMKRAREGGVAEKAGDEIYRQFEAAATYSQALELQTEILEQLGVKLCEVEEDYLVFHLTSFLHQQALRKEDN